jgi:DNA polymerase-3 subunit beta
MEVIGNLCSLESGSFSTKVNGLPAEEFPPIPEFKEQSTIRMEQIKVKSMLRRTAYAVSIDENRYVLNGLFLSFREKKLTMVATDGRRLALAEEEVEQTQEKPLEIIVPTKAIQELSRQLGEEGEIEIRITENQASFSMGKEKEEETVVVTKLVEGAYPNYKQVIPSESKHRVTLDKEELLHAVRRAEIMTSDKSNSVKMTFTENTLKLTANTPEVGESQETIAINYSGEETSIAFNPQYLIAIVSWLSPTSGVFAVNFRVFSVNVIFTELDLSLVIISALLTACKSSSLSKVTLCFDSEGITCL